MKKQEVDRRKFNHLTAAALGGLVAGTVAGCGGKAKDKKKKAPKKKAAAGGKKPKKKELPVGTDLSLLLSEPHVCRGLNSCKDQGASKKNACAGQGACATVAKHSCHGENECKGRGGCHDIAGVNACKGKGKCGVPLSADEWTKTRKIFETVYKSKKGKDLGPAPAPGGAKKAPETKGKKTPETKGKKTPETKKKKAPAKK